MSDYLRRIAASSTWQEYYDAHKAVYTTIFQAYWGFGNPGFAQQLHHTAIPDVSGTVSGAMNWAVYSQPSAETLESFIAVFVEQLRSEPHRIRSSRYLFFVTAGPPAPRERIEVILGPLARHVDYWCGSFDDVLSANPPTNVALGLEALFGSRCWVGEVDKSMALGRCAPSTLKAFRDTALLAAASSNSVAPSVIRDALVDSSIILLGVSTGCTADTLTSVLGKERVGIAAYIARERARSSLWQNDAVVLCQDLLTRYPPQVEEYVVRPGDILSRIIRERYEISYERLWPLIRVLNSDLRDPNLILVGQRLRLPVLGVEGRASGPTSR